MARWGKLGRAVVAAAAAATPLAAQRGMAVSAGPSWVVPAGRIGTYVASGSGVGASARIPWRHRGLVLRIDFDYLDAGPTTRTRPWGGATSPYTVTIVTGTRAFALSAGPEIGGSRGPFRLGLAAGAGAAPVSNASAVSGLYDLDPFARAATHTGVTWLLSAGAVAGVRLGGGRTPVGLELSVRWLGMGRTGIVREDHLPVGLISGVYLYPTPTQTRFLITRAAVTIGP